MGIHIIVFVEKPPTQKQSNIVKCIQTKLPVMVDALHNSDPTYFEKFTNGRFFFVSEFLSMCTVEELTHIAPDFVVSFNDDYEITNKEWVSISRYFENLIFPEFNHIAVLQPAILLLEQFAHVVPETIPDASVPDLNEHYELYLKHVEERDAMLIQVEKPFCDLPYTVVIRNYGERGLTSFFTDLFVCDSWGVSRKDYEFLELVWKHWNMKGTYDLDTMLREATRRCFPQEGEQPCAEPEVYRRPIENVLDTFKKRDHGEYVKDLDQWNQQRLQKRKLEDDLLIN
jgi:hypothetical protein